QANHNEVYREDKEDSEEENHKRSKEAIKNVSFKDEIVPVEVKQRFVGAKNKIEETSFMFDTDEGVRPGTTPEILGKLRPAFSVKGSVTAGNSSQMSDGAGSVLVM